jgi:hypothetical protein
VDRCPGFLLLISHLVPFIPVLFKTAARCLIGKGVLRTNRALSRKSLWGQLNQMRNRYRAATLCGNFFTLVLSIPNARLTDAGTRCESLSWVSRVSRVTSWHNW